MAEELAVNANQLAYFRALEELRKSPGFILRFVGGELDRIDDRADALRAAGSIEGQEATHRVGLCFSRTETSKLDALGSLEHVSVLWCESLHWVEAVGRLKRPAELSRLVVRNQSINEEADCLAACTGLRGIDFWDCRLGPQALTALAGRKNLTLVKFSNCLLDEQVKRDLRTLPGLVGLDLSGTNVTDADFAEWELPATLESVGLNQTDVGDATVERMGGLPNLEGLYLAETNVTEQCLMHLASLPALRELDIARTGVSEERLACFLREHPEIEHVDFKAALEEFNRNDGNR